MKLGAREMREATEADVSEYLKTAKRNPFYLILENVYDTYNVGGLFRLADALFMEKIYLCGQMEVPPNSKIKKASIGTDKVVPWEYKKTAAEAIEDLRSSRLADARSNNKATKTPPRWPDGLLGGDPPIAIIAIEQHKKAFEYTKAEYNFPLALIVGNETSGVLPETLELADQIVEIPMWGINKSLNVIVSAAIVVYHATLSLPRVISNESASRRSSEKSRSDVTSDR